MVVRFELQMLAELGFGLDLAQCAATGATRRLDLCVAEIGPRGVARGRRALGRQDAAAAGLPARRRRRRPQGRDLADGFALTGFFLTRHVLEPRGLMLADERALFHRRAGARAAERGVAHDTEKPARLVGWHRCSEMIRPSKRANRPGSQPDRLELAFRPSSRYETRRQTRSQCQRG